jgi:hypothetical protein
LQEKERRENEITLEKDNIVERNNLNFTCILMLDMSTIYIDSLGRKNNVHKVGVLCACTS